MGSWEDTVAEKSDVARTKNSATEKDIIAMTDRMEKKMKEEQPKKFQFKEADSGDKVVVTVYGLKGDGKTAFSLNEKHFPGSVSALSFDNKTVQIKNNFFDKAERIKVYNAIEHYSDDPDIITTAAENTYNYILFLLENIKKEKPDWVLIDGLEIFAQIGEMVMRNRHSIKPFSGVTNRNVWKERRLILRSVHKAAVEACKKGVIYTTYTDRDEIVEEGTTKTLNKVPKWTDVVMWETDIVVYIYAKSAKEGRKYYYEVISSKLDKFMKSGDVHEITRK